MDLLVAFLLIIGLVFLFMEAVQVITPRINKFAAFAFCWALAYLLTHWPK